jgi:signal transduction histidine kinase/ActR/RegA family two-component response regulator
LLLVGSDAGRARLGVLLAQWTGTPVDIDTAPRLSEPAHAAHDLILLDQAADPHLIALQAFAQTLNHPPVIVLSPAHDPAFEELAIGAGAVDCLPADRLDARLLGHAVRWAAARSRIPGAPRRLATTTGREILDAQALQSEKMDALGRLAGGVAHDFNNLLTAIIGFSDMLLDQMSEQDPRYRDAREVRKAAGRGTALTRQLLAFSRKQVALAPSPIDLSGIVVAFEPMLRRLIGEHIHLALDAASALPRIIADAGQIEQVVMNLVVNARDAMPGGGRVTLETFAVDMDPLRARRHAGTAPGRHVALAVTDNGCGMSEDVQAHLFEPFFTTKAHGQGTGLGLASVYGIVGQFGGFVEIASRPGHGTRVEVCFPAVTADAVLPAEGAAVAEVAGGHETVLVVEDDQTVRDMIAELLRRGGYRVLDAVSGEEAIAVADLFPGPIHLLLTDVVMPEMSGPALMARLAGTRPALRALYVSGYTGDAGVLSKELHPDADFLQKPFPPGTLMHRVRRALDHAGSTFP